MGISLVTEYIFQLGNIIKDRPYPILIPSIILSVLSLSSIFFKNTHKEKIHKSSKWPGPLPAYYRSTDLHLQGTVTSMLPASWFSTT